MSQTIVAMWCLGALWGNAGANAVARERERDTLPLATLTGLRAGEYLSRSIQPAIQSGSMFLLGMGAGMFAASYSDLAETLTQKRLETEEIAQSMLCAAGFGVAALAIGLAFSAKCRTALAARVWTFLTLFALWLHWTLIGHLSMDVFGVIDESGYPIVVQGIFRSIAGAQIAFSTALIYLNPFAWLDLCFWHESAATFITIQGQRVLFDAASGLPAAPPMLERHEALFEGAWRLLAGTDPDEGASMAAFALITIALPMVSIAWLYRQVRRRLIEADFFVP